MYLTVSPSFATLPTVYENGSFLTNPQIGFKVNPSFKILTKSGKHFVNIDNWATREEETSDEN